MLESALQYAALGWHVIPLKPNCKTPLIKKWPDLASVQEAQIHKWWSSWPSANIGILTGRKSGFFAVDIDPRNGCSLGLLLDNRYAIPNTAVQKTGSDGSHLLFSYPDHDIISRNGYPVEGIDICSDGKYIVAAPSIHPNGEPYQWMHEPHQLASAPDWLVCLLNQTKATIYNSEDTIQKGVRNDRLYRMGCSLRKRGTTKRDLGIELHRINIYQCKPPLCDIEVNRIIDSINQTIDSDKSPLFRYRDYIRSDEFPKDATLRHILHVISFYMDRDGNRAYPTEDQIANDTGYTRRTVVDKLKKAVANGYIIRRKHKTEHQQYFNYIYFLPPRFMKKADRRVCESSEY